MIYIELFNTQEIIKIYILLEKKLVFFIEYWKLNICYYDFLTIIFPFKYQYQIISILHKDKLNIKNTIILINIDNGLINI